MTDAALDHRDLESTYAAANAAGRADLTGECPREAVLRALERFEPVRQGEAA